MTKHTLTFLLLLFLITCSICAQSVNTEEITFVHIGLNDGLSQSTVFAIDQDNKGNMWFATYDGVNKYDGYAFTVYQHDSSNPNSIANDIARTIKVDSQGRIWIGTRDGLSCYDEKKDVFLNYFYERNGIKSPVNCIVEIDKDHLLAGTPEKLLLFDIKNQQFMDDTLGTAVHKLVATTLARHENDIYIGTSEGVYVYSSATGQIRVLTKALENKRIQAILRQSSTRLWVATEGAGLFLFNPNTQEIRNYRHIAGNANSISSDFIRSLALDGQSRLWIGTFNDLNIYHEGSDSFVSYTSNPVQEGSLSQNSVRSVFVDSQEGIWLGTYFGGLNYYHPLKNRFRNIKRIPYKNSLNDNIVSCIVEDKYNNLWIGTNDGGLNHFNTETRRFTAYTLEEGKTNTLASNNVKAVYVDEEKDLVYIGSHAGGLNILNRKTGRMETFNARNSLLKDDNVYAIVPTSGGQLWIGTLAGLYKFDPARKQITEVLKEEDGSPLRSKRITLLHNDSKGRLWVGGENGLIVYSQQGDKLQSLPVLPSGSPLERAFTNCIYEAGNGLIWIGTREGVYGLDEKKNRIRHYTTAHSLPNNVVYGILEDSYNRLWMSTNKGLTCFDPETETFRNFTETDGLQSNQFNSSSYCRTASGQMYFGGVNGITTFRPELLLDNPYAPPVVMTNLRVFHKTIRPGDETGILSQNINQTENITLNASQNSFSLEFVVSNYISGQHNTFAYMLDGYDKEWYYLTDGSRMVSYSNLPHGKYTFQVKAANSDGKWNNNPTTLQITVLPVWYKTWWALLLFFTASVALIIFIFRFLWIRKSMQAQLEIERMDKVRQEEVNQMKMRFFINISHELRTPLTLILAPLQEIMNRVSDRWTRNQLEHVRRNANRLLHLVNQLMDYRRAELGVFQLKVKQEIAWNIVQENFLFYDKLAKNKHIEYTLHSDIQEKEMLFDPNYLELIMNNLLSNAFKYTEEGQSITVTLTEENNELLFRVSDTGIGIPADKQDKIFQRFYQIKTEHLGSGIGLSLVKRLVDLHHGRITLQSEEGKGSTFTVYLPQDENCYTESERNSNTDSPAEEDQVYTTNVKDVHFIESEPVESQSGEKPESKRGTILIVEDNDEIRRYLCEGLSDLFTTVDAANGEEALNYLRENEADVIITDVMMPVMDGIKLTKQIKQNIRTCHIPVFILSAKTDIRDQLEGLHVGADDYIPKPFTMAVLTAKIQNMLRTRRRTFEHYSRSLEVEPEKITFNMMDEELLRKAKLIVEKNMDNVEFSADEFAREMNMSRSNLHLKLKAVTGESTIDFIRKIRFNEACKLLEDGRYNIAEVSTMVGFNTPSYFATSFKKYFGYLPTEYVKSRRG